MYNKEIQHSYPIIINEKFEKLEEMEKVKITKQKKSANNQDNNNQDDRVNEGFLQKTLHLYGDELLPIKEFDESFFPLTSIGREINNIDNLFLSPNGKLTLVETKLWRNPEARREVIAQILEYAAELKTWNYESLEQKCKQGNKQNCVIDDSLFDYMKKKFKVELSDEDNGENETNFIDNVNKYLRRGELLLLIVGDGIKSNVLNILNTLNTQTINESGSSINSMIKFSMFTFGLIELKIYNLKKNNSKLIIPNIISIVKPELRGVVEIKADGDNILVNADGFVLNEKQNTKSNPKPLNPKEFYEHLEKKEGSDTRNTVKRILDNFENINEDENKYIDWSTIGGPTMKYKINVYGKDEKINFGMLHKDGIFESTNRIRLTFEELVKSGKEWNITILEKEYFHKLREEVFPGSQYRAPTGKQWFLYANGDSNECPKISSIICEKQFVKIIDDFINTINNIISSIN